MTGSYTSYQLIEFFQDTLTTMAYDVEKPLVVRIGLIEYGGVFANGNRLSSAQSKVL